MRGGVVTAPCGVRFAPRRFGCGCGAHPVAPPDADQVCVVCRTAEGPPVSVAVGWAVSRLDQRWHAVDERRNHPSGVWVADCGHRVLSTGLHDAPGGRVCELCASMQLARALPSPRSDG